MLRKLKQSDYVLYCCQSGVKKRVGRHGHISCVHLRDVYKRYKTKEGWVLEIECDNETCPFNTIDTRHD
jgi:hypothetical protein